MSQLAVHAPALNVGDVMTAVVHRVRPDMKVHEAVALLIRYQISGAPVTDQLDNVISVVSEGDLLRLAASHGLESSIASCLVDLPKPKDLITVQTHNTFLDAYRLFLKHTLHRIIVIDANGRLHGVVTRADILRLFVEARFGKKIQNWSR